MTRAAHCRRTSRALRKVLNAADAGGAFQAERGSLCWSTRTIRSSSSAPIYPACMDTLGHVPAWTEVLGGDLIELRFGGWLQALRSIAKRNSTTRRTRPRVQNTQLFRDEFDRQRALDKQKKLEKKAESRERIRQEKAARKAAKKA